MTAESATRARRRLRDSPVSRGALEAATAPRRESLAAPGRAAAVSRARSASAAARPAIVAEKIL
jgi:hypothetical protein